MATARGGKDGTLGAAVVTTPPHRHPYPSLPGCEPSDVALPPSTVRWKTSRALASAMCPEWSGGFLPLSPCPSPAASAATTRMRGQGHEREREDGGGHRRPEPPPPPACRPSLLRAHRRAITTPPTEPRCWPLASRQGGGDGRHHAPPLRPPLGRHQHTSRAPGGRKQAIPVTPPPNPSHPPLPSHPPRPPPATPSR